MHENELSYMIRGAAFKVHDVLGPGLLESVYEHALSHELRKEGLLVENQLALPVEYDGIRMDIMVNNKVIIEIKSVEDLRDVHFKQLLTYLKLSGIKLGLLINFNVPLLKTGMHRIVNGL